MKKTYLIFFTILSFYFLNAQQKCLNKSINLKLSYSKYEWRVNNNFEEALTNYLEISELGYNKPYINLNIAKLGYILKKDSLAYHHLKRFIIEGGQSWSSIAKNKELFNLMPVNDSIKFTKEFTKLEQEFKSRFNLGLYKTLLFYHFTDQYFATQKILVNQSEQHKIREKIFQNNLTSLRKIFINNGELPQSEDLGVYTKPIYLILLHHRRKDSIDSVNYNFYKKLLRKEICEGKTYLPSVYAKFIDNMDEVFSKGEHQVYGEFVDFRNNQIFPLKNPKLVNCYRNEIGMISIEEYAKLRNAKLPVNYIKNDSCTIRK